MTANLAHWRTRFGWASAFAVMAIAMLAMRQSFVVRGAKGLTPWQVAVVLGVLFLLWQWVFHRRVPLPVPRSVAVVLVLWGCGAMLSYSAAATRGLRFDQLSGADQSLIGAVLSATTAALLISVIRTIDDVVILLQGLVIGGTISALQALMQVATGFDLSVLLRVPVILKDDTATLVTDLARGDAVRPQGAAGHPLELNAILTVLIPIAIGLALMVRERGGRWWIWGGMAIVLLLGALSTVSRSLVLGLVVAGAVMMVGWPLRRVVATLGAITVAAMGAWAFKVPMAVEMAQVLTEGSDDGSLGSRAFGIDYVAQEFSRHLWVGQGVGTYDLNTQPVLDNEYLSRLMEQGLIGVAALAATLLLGMWCGWDAALVAKNSGREGLSHLCRAVAGSIAATAAIAAILDIGGFRQISMTMVILIAAAVILRRACRTLPNQVTSVARVHPEAVAA